MSNAPVKTRFAPSPTGYLHLGNVRTALFNALLAGCEGGVFLLRIEDTDRERSRPAYLEALAQDLRWLGLDWDEGYDAGGDRGPYRQSERDGIYQGYFDTLREADLAYPCFCSPGALERSRKAQRAAGQPPRYAGTCARLSREEGERRLAAGEEATLRFRVPAGEKVSFIDAVRGPQSFDSDDIGDFIIRRADGSAAFFFCNAVDDALMGVTHVFRGNDHLTNTPRQILVLQALDLPLPAYYGHISLIVGEDGAPLSKRHGSYSVRELREAGYLPGAVVNYLARLGHGYVQAEPMGLDALARRFDVARLTSSPARFDPAQLRHWQREALVDVSRDALWEWLPDEVRGAVPGAERDAFVDAVRENILFPGEAVPWVGRLFGDELSLEPDALSVIAGAGEGFYEAALRVLDEEPVDFKAFAGGVKAATGARGKALFGPLRAALTGVVHGPEMRQLFPLIGPERARRRLNAALHRARERWN